MASIAQPSNGEYDVGEDEAEAEEQDLDVEGTTPEEVSNRLWVRKWLDSVSVKRDKIDWKWLRRFGRWMDMEPRSPIRIVLYLAPLTVPWYF